MAGPYLGHKLPDINRDSIYTDNLTFSNGFPELKAFIVRNAVASWEHFTNVDMREDDPLAENQLSIVSTVPSLNSAAYATGTTQVTFHSQRWWDVDISVPTQKHFLALSLHEVGHTFGLDHAFGHHPTVMDYGFTDTEPSTYDVDSMNNLYGTAAISVRSGTDADEAIVGSTGADQLSGMGGADTITGDGDADRLYGGDGDDVIYGNFDQDLIVGGDGNDTLLGGRDSDTLSGGGGDDVLVGGLGGDLFVLSSGADRIEDFDYESGDRLTGLSSSASNAVDGADGAEIGFGDGSTVVLVGVAASEVNGSWFLNWML